MIAIELLVKASLVMLAAAFAVAVLGRRVSAASRHLVYTLATCALLGLPLLSLALPEWPVTWLPATPSVAAVAPAVTPVVTAADGPVFHATSRALTRASIRATLVAPSGSAAADTAPADPSLTTESRRTALVARIPWSALIVLIYLAGVGVLVARIAFEQLKARRLRRRTTPLNAPEWQRLLAECARDLGTSSSARLLCSPDRMSPLATGVWHHAIVLPAVAESWSGEMRRAVLLHELAHVARRDCLTQLAVAFTCAFYWMHPGAWWLARRLRVERELACDDRVLSAGADADDYAGHLLELSYSLRAYGVPALAVGMASPRQLETRMLAILDSARARTSLTRRRRVALFAVCVAIVLPIAALTARTTAPDDGQAVSTPRARYTISRQFMARLLTVDYWRDTAARQLARLADEMQYLAEMRELGYSLTDVDVLFRLRQHGVTPDSVRALAAAGLSPLSPEDLLTAASHGISARYINDLSGLGYAPLDLATLTRMRSHGIDGDLIRELSDVGFSQLPIDVLVRTQSHGISPDFIRELHDFGYDWSIDELLKARTHGVDFHYLYALTSLGYPGLSLEQLVSLRTHGVTSARVRVANAAAGTRLTVDQLIERSSRGWR